MSPAIVFGLIAGTGAVLAEYLYKVWPMGKPWTDGLLMWVPIQLVIGYCIFRMVTAPGATILDAVIVFALATAVLRVILTLFILHQPVPLATWVGFGLVVLANFIKPIMAKLGV